MILWEYVHTIPLYQRPELAAVNANVANYGAFGLMTPAHLDRRRLDRLIGH